MTTHNSKSKSFFLFEKAQNDSHIFIDTPHYHDYFELYYMDSGSCNYLIDNKIYNVIENDIVLIRKNTFHKTSYLTENRNRTLIFFTLENISHELHADIHKFFDSVVYTPSPSNRSFITDIFSKIELEYNAQTSISKALIKCYMTELFAFMLRNSSSYKHPHSISKINVIIEDIFEHININFSRDLTLEDLAKRANLSKNYMSKFFKLSTGFNLSEYITLIRIKNAKVLLSETKKSISTIAYQCGFNDSNYFSTVFKRSERISPLQYRKRNLGN